MKPVAPSFGLAQPIPGCCIHWWSELVGLRSLSFCLSVFARLSVTVNQIKEIHLFLEDQLIPLVPSSSKDAVVCGSQVVHLHNLLLLYT